MPIIVVLSYFAPIRNNRNVGHVGADVDSSQMDASVVVAMVKWVMAELIRIFHGCSTEAASTAVEVLTDRTIPLLWKVGGRIRVLGAHLSASDKVIVLLYGMDEAVAVREAARIIEYSNVARLRRDVLQVLHGTDMVHLGARRRYGRHYPGRDSLCGGNYRA